MVQYSGIWISGKQKGLVMTRRIMIVMATGKCPLQYAARIVKQTGLRLFGSWRRLLILSCVVLLVMAYLHVNLNATSLVESRPWESREKCGVSSTDRKHLMNITNQVCQILDEMHIVHWLFYGTLWEMRRLKFPLMSGDSVDIGILANQVFTEKTWREFIAPFKSAGFIVSGNKERLFIEGSMNFRRNPFKDLLVKVYTFYSCHGVVQRTGLWSWLFFMNYKKYHSFPSSFLAPALPKARFGTVDIPVPRGGLEILRYIYPTHWNENRTSHCYFTKPLLD